MSYLQNNESINNTYNYKMSSTNFKRSNISPEYIDIPIENFNFSLTHSNMVRPNYIRKLNLGSLINENRIEELNDVLNIISQENFEENEYFDFTREERELIKKYQIVMQYMLYSINCLSKKNNVLNHVTEEQVKYNQEAENMINKQQKKIREQDQVIEELTNNCVNMEFLIRELGLEDQALTLGIALENVEKERNIKERQKRIINKQDFHKNPEKSEGELSQISNPLYNQNEYNDNIKSNQSTMKKFYPATDKNFGFNYNEGNINVNNYQYYSQGNFNNNNMQNTSQNYKDDITDSNYNSQSNFNQYKKNEFIPNNINIKTSQNINNSVSSSKDDFFNQKPKEVNIKKDITLDNEIEENKDEFEDN